MAVLITIVFALGYVLIALEHPLRLNKTATALITGALCWGLVIAATPDHSGLTEALVHHLGDVSQILFFLLGAMTIVELVDAHDGFEIITSRINTLSRRRLLLITAVLAFLLSAILDNLTTTIILVSLLRKLVREREDRLLLTGLVIIAANAGGVWSPIGDVTTTMLWIGGQISAGNIIRELIIPSIACIAVPGFILWFRMKGSVSRPTRDEGQRTVIPAAQRNTVFVAGLIALLLVPVLKTLFHIPPFLGMLGALGVLWIIVEIIHRGEDKPHEERSVAYALRKIDAPSILFFLGILLAISALETTGQLEAVAHGLDMHVGNYNLIAIIIGGLSAVVDNVPILAAVMGMYNLEQFPQDHSFWELIAYTTGTGGSLLLIGSAAGVAAMGIEQISFGWYMKNISWLALLGFLAGAGVYLLM